MRAVSERVAREGVPAVQIQTGGSCHLTAAMVEKGLQALSLDEVDLLLAVADEVGEELVVFPDRREPLRHPLETDHTVGDILATLNT